MANRDTSTPSGAAPVRTKRTPGRAISSSFGTRSGLGGPSGPRYRHVVDGYVVVSTMSAAELDKYEPRRRAGILRKMLAATPNPARADVGAAGATS